MSTEPIRVGLLAYGAIGYEHNLAVQNTNGLVLTAVCDTKPERIAAARELAQDFVAFSDATEMLDSGLLDLVVISTPPNSHFHWAKESLKRNINVVLEKPMALTADESDELIKLADENNVCLYVDNLFILRNEIKELKIESCNNIEFTWLKEGPFKDTLVNDLLYHDLYILVHLLVREIYILRLRCNEHQILNLDS